MNSRAITNIKVGDTFYLDLKWLGPEWFEKLNLPSYDSTIYAVYAVVVKKVSAKKFLIHTPVFDTPKQKYVLEKKAYFFYAYGNLKPEDVHADPAKYKIVDENLIREYPQLVEYTKRGG